MSIKIRMQIEVSDGYDEIFAHKQVVQAPSFGKESITDALLDFSADATRMIKSSVSMQKMQDQKAIA